MNASTWVVWANTQFAIVGLFPLLFLIHWARAQVASVDESVPKLGCKCGSNEGCAFWGLGNDQSPLGVQTPKTRNFWGVNRHFKPNLPKNSNRHIFKTMHRICTKYDILWKDFREWLGYIMTMQQFQDDERPPSWISISGHSFSVDKHFCTKFGTVMENWQPKAIHCSEIRFSTVSYTHLTLPTIYSV